MENRALQILHNDYLDKQYILQAFLQKYDFAEFQTKVTPQHSQYYSIGSTEPIWVCISEVTPDTIWFYYASEVEENGKPKPGPVGTRKAHDIKVGDAIGNCSEEAFKQINKIFSFIGTTQPVFLQVITTKSGKLHTWEAAYHVYAHEAIQDVYRQNKEKK